MRITLTEKDANELRNHINSVVQDATIRRDNTVAATMKGAVYQQANEILQLYMRIRAEINRKEAVEQ